MVTAVATLLLLLSICTGSADAEFSEIKDMEAIGGYVTFAGPLGSVYGDLYHDQDLPADSYIEAMYIECQSDVMPSERLKVNVGGAESEGLPYCVAVFTSKLYTYEVSQSVSGVTSLKDIKAKVQHPSYCWGKAFYKFIKPEKNDQSAKLFCGFGVAEGQDFFFEANIDQVEERGLAVTVDFDYSYGNALPQENVPFYINGNRQEISGTGITNAQGRYQANPVDISSAKVKFEIKGSDSKVTIFFMTFTISYGNSPDSPSTWECPVDHTKIENGGGACTNGDDSTCNTGGNCIDSKCECWEGYRTGTLCEIGLRSWCSDGGTFNIVTGVCDCDQHRFGFKCKYDRYERCSNGGHVVNVGDEKCACKCYDNRVGPSCENDRYKLCNYNGRYEDDDGSGKAGCVCYDGHSGPTCDGN